MSATTIRGSSPADAIYSGNYPLAVRGVLTGFPNQGPLHTLGYWQSDNAVDIAVPVGTDVVAVASGFVRARGTWAVPFNLSSQTSGWEVLLLGDDGNNYFYSRLSQRLVTDGEHVVQGQVIGKSGGANGVPHLHVAIQPMPTNQVPNPSFEHDAVGAAPASWVNGSTPSTVFQVQNAWASKGAQSLYVVTQAMLSTLAATTIVDTGVTSRWGRAGIRHRPGPEDRDTRGRERHRDHWVDEALHADQLVHRRWRLPQQQRGRYSDGCARRCQLLRGVHRPRHDRVHEGLLDRGEQCERQLDELLPR